MDNPQPSSRNVIVAFLLVVLAIVGGAVLLLSTRPQPVRITIKAGQTLTHEHWARTDEGWSSESHTWTFDGEHLTRSWCTDGRDCDGCLRHTGEDIAIDIAKFEDCTGATFNGKVIHYPEWQETTPDRVYDEYAQAANY